MPTGFYLQMTGIISVFLTWLAITFILHVTERNLARSVSHHAAIKKSSHLIFSLLMSGSLVLMLIFIYYWLIPTYELSVIFSIIIGIAILLESITTWVPLTTGWRYTTHQLCSYGAACLLPVLMLLTALSPKTSNIARYICMSSMSIMLSLLYLFLFIKPVRRHYLIYQNMYVIAFHVALLSMIRII